MNKFKVFLTIALTLVITTSVAFAVVMSVDEVIELQSKTEMALGGFYAPEITGLLEMTQVGTATTTVRATESGTTFYLNPTNGAGQTITLPAVENGMVLKFVVSAVIADNNWIIDSAEGDNISGSLVVDGTAVPCAAEDQINVVASAEILGDMFELRSDGTNWFVTGIGEASGSLTCTDPS